MLFDNGRFTERQRGILCELGRDRRKTLEREKRRSYWRIFGGAVCFAALMAALLLLDREEGLAYLIFLVPLGLIALIVLVRQKQRRFRELSQMNDYDLGLYYADRDRRVAGNAEKSLKRNRVLFLLLGTVCMACAVLMLFLIQYEPMDFSACRRVEGPLENAEYYSGRGERIEIHLSGDSTVYRVNGLYVDEFDWDEFYLLASRGDTMVLLTDETSKGKCRVYYAESNGHALLTEEEVRAADEHNSRIGFAVGIAMLVAGLATFACYPIYRRLIYRRNLAAEIYDLSFTEEERSAILNVREQGAVDAARPALLTDDQPGGERAQQRIELRSPRWITWFFLFFAVACDIGSLCVFLFADPSERLLVGFALLGVSLIGWVGIILLRSSKTILDGDRLICISFGRKKEIPIREISLVVITKSAACCLDRAGKKLCSLDVLYQGFGDVIDVLEQYGCVVMDEIPN